jgi:hypothetical protein
MLNLVKGSGIAKIRAGEAGSKRDRKSETWEKKWNSA